MSKPPTRAQWTSAKRCDSFRMEYTTSKRQKKVWEFSVGSFCLIMHERLEDLRPKERTQDMFWKARIVEIRRPKTKERAGKKSPHYVRVKWFYSREDVEEVKPQGLEEVDRYLGHTAQQELFASDDQDIIGSEAIAALLDRCEIILLKDDLLDQPPVVTYFTRFFWNKVHLCLQGPRSHCGIKTCPGFWNPDLEEQRFCWTCRKWFHRNCLYSMAIASQAQRLEEIVKKNPEIPLSILEVAFQPTARGGNLHYTAGNIRFVNMARSLLEYGIREHILANPDPWMAVNVASHQGDQIALWWNYMVYEKNIDLDKEDSEQLLLTTLHKAMKMEVSAQEIDLTEAILKSKHLIVVLGAGVSRAAGIQAFRGEEGLYSKGFEEVFQNDVFKNAKACSEHAKLMADLAKAAARAEPTAFHRLLKILHCTGILGRVYTQNIDDLEFKAGLGSYEDDCVCVQLHGSVMKVVCTRCSFREHIYHHFSSLKDGELAECPDCEKKNEERRSIGKRVATACGLLRPAIILYGETHPEGEHIAEMQLQDIPKADNLLVVGTSLKTPGVVRLIRDFSTSLRINRRGNVYYMDLENPPRSHLTTFDHIIRADCQAFASYMLSRIPSLQPTPSPPCFIPKDDLGEWVDPGSIRKDNRPSWDWV